MTCPNCAKLKATVERLERELAEERRSVENKFLRSTGSEIAIRRIDELNLALHQALATAARLREALEVVRAHYDCYTPPNVVLTVDAALAEQPKRGECEECGG